MVPFSQLCLDAERDWSRVPTQELTYARTLNAIICALLYDPYYGCICKRRSQSMGSHRARTRYVELLTQVWQKLPCTPFSIAQRMRTHPVVVSCKCVPFKCHAVVDASKIWLGTHARSQTETCTKVLLAAFHDYQSGKITAASFLSTTRAHSPTKLMMRERYTHRSRRDTCFRRSLVFPVTKGVKVVSMTTCGPLAAKENTTASLKLKIMLAQWISSSTERHQYFKLVLEGPKI